MAEVAYPEAYLECMKHFYMSITFKTGDTQGEARELWSLDNRTSTAVMFSRMVREAAGGLQASYLASSSDVLQGIHHAVCVPSFAWLVQDVTSLKGIKRQSHQRPSATLRLWHAGVTRLKLVLMLRYLAFVHRMLKEAELEAPELKANDSDIDNIIANLLVGPRDVAPLPVDGPQVWLPLLLISSGPFCALAMHQMAAPRIRAGLEVCWTFHSAAGMHSCGAVYTKEVIPCSRAGAGLSKCLPSDFSLYEQELQEGTHVLKEAIHAPRSADMHQSQSEPASV